MVVEPVSMWGFAQKINLEDWWEVSSSPSILSPQVCELPYRAARSAGGGRGKRTRWQDHSQAICERTAGMWGSSLTCHGFSSPLLSGALFWFRHMAAFIAAGPVWAWVLRSDVLSYIFKENDNYILGPKFQKGLKSIVTESDRDSIASPML